MRTIIAGTDFTPSSVNACKYAAMLAQKLNCKLTIFNLFEAPVVHSNVGLYGFTYSSIKSESFDKTNKFILQLSKLFPKVHISKFVTNGIFKDELKDFIGNHHVELAVMGLETKGRISKFLFGSRGVDVAGKIDAPVIIVPEKYKKHKLSKVLLAVDNTEKLHRSSLKSFESFVNDSKTKIKVLHVRTEDELFASKTSSLIINNKKNTIVTVKTSDLESGVKKYSKKEGIDLVSIISKKHSAFYNLFVESNTKKVAFASNLPVMAIHE